MSRAKFQLGVDLGGTKIEVAVLDSEGIEHFRRREPTPQGDYEKTIEAIRDLIVHAEKELSFNFPSIGIGIPGAASLDTGLIKNANSTCLIGKPFQLDLANSIKKEVFLDNDANCFALSEATDGAAKDSKVIFGVILGTGVGGGIVVDKKVLRGRNSIAGEWGHNPLPWPKEDELDGPICYCGKKGCIETWISGPALAAQFEKVSSRPKSTRQIFDLYQKGDPRALRLLKSYFDRFARSLAMLINILDPDVIVLGGGLSNFKDLYLETPQLLRKYVFSDSIKTSIVKNQFGDSSGVRGAVWLNPNNL